MGPCGPACPVAMAMTPEQEAAYALDFNVPREQLRPEVQAVYDRLVTEGRPVEAPGPPRPPRFPSSPETRRGVLDAIAKVNPKYARPFDQEGVAKVSLIGTESWSEYGGVLLQMAILDTLLSIEAKLSQEQ